MTPLDNRRVKRIIDRLDVAHNGRLTAWLREGQAPVMVALWAEKLGGLTDDEIKAGLALAESTDRPPTPDQFRSFCRKLPAYQSHQPRPALPHIDPEQAEENQAFIQRRIQQRAMRRCLYRAGYGSDEHAKAVKAVRAEGLPIYVADMRAMAHHGWNEALEAAHRRAWMALPGRRLVCPEHKPNHMALYPPHHEPPDWVIRTTDYARVDEWIKTGQLPTEDAA